VAHHIRVAGPTQRAAPVRRWLDRQTRDLTRSAVRRASEKRGTQGDRLGTPSVSDPTRSCECRLLASLTQSRKRHSRAWARRNRQAFFFP
jgi:hypothetical protein